MNTDHYEQEYLHTETGKLTDAGETVVLQSYFSAFILRQIFLNSKAQNLPPHLMIPAVPVEVNELLILQAVFHAGLVFN